MFKDQLYNKAGRDCGQLSPNTHTFRRLNRRIHHNMGLLNTSRSSNHSSFRMGRTELSGDRHSSSRDINQGSQYMSTLPTHQIASEKSIPKKMGSILSAGRRRLNNQSSKPYLTNRAGPKNIVQNLYMLTNNQKQYMNSPQRYNKPQNLEPVQRHRSPYDSKQRTRQQNYQQDNENRVHSKSKLGQRQRSREQNVHKQQRDFVLKQQNKQIRRLQEKYLQNIYELNSPKEGKSAKRISERQMAINKQLQLQKQPNNKHSINSNNSSKNINQYYFQHDHQAPSTSGSATTQQNPSFNVSEASLPLHSIASQKDTPKNIKSPSRLYQKTSIKLDRAKQRKKQKIKQAQPQSSSLSLRWKMNNIQLEQRKDEPSKKSGKVIEQGRDECLESVFLPIQSKQQQEREWAQDILQRIILHLDYLNIIANYTKQFRKMYDNTEQWQTLIFLSYKKFYIQRTKVANILKPILSKSNDQSKLCALDNPFILPYSKIDEGELKSFRGSRQCIALRYELQAEDNQIRNALRGLYNLYIEKSGDHVNMFDCDNFSEEIYKLMLEQTQAISENLDDSALVEATKLRMGKIIQTGLLIAYLNGKYVKNFAQILLHQDTVKVGKRQTLRQDCVADLFIGQFKKVLS